MEEVLQQFYHKKQVLVTGGAGFIGSHLVEKLVQLGARVTVLDNFSSGNLRNLKSIASAVNLMYADVRSPYGCSRATTQQEIVFHLAAFVSVPESFVHPELCALVNTQGTKNLLEAAHKSNVKTVVISSSSAVYGNRDGICRETDPTEPMSPYATSKLNAEKLCTQFALEKNLNAIALRYFNVYGERQNPHGAYAAVVAKFTNLLKDGQPITIYGDGSQTRDFIPVAQAVQANLIAGMAQDVGGEVFNVGTGQSINLIQLVQQLEKELAVEKKEILFNPARQGDILHSQADCDKFTFFAQKVVGQTAKTW